MAWPNLAKSLKTGGLKGCICPRSLTEQGHPAFQLPGPESWYRPIPRTPRTDLVGQDYFAGLQVFLLRGLAAVPTEGGKS